MYPRGFRRFSGQRTPRETSLWHRVALTLAVLALIGIALAVEYGAGPVIQRTLNGFVTGSYLAMAAIGLTFVYGILNLVNFAHGDFIMLGAYVALAVDTGLHAGLLPAIVCAFLAVAVLAVGLEFSLWAPLRHKGAGPLELVLASIGLAFVLRYLVQFIAGPDLQTLNVNVTSYFRLGGGVTIGKTIAGTAVVAFTILIAISLLLKYSKIGKQMRALADNPDLAETSGLNSKNLIRIVWIFGGGLAGLAGALYVTSTGGFTPEFGFSLMLPVFAAVLVGGAGDPYGALVGGLFMGVAEEWSTLVVAPSWKTVVGFSILLLTLLFRPQGIFAPASRV